MSTKDIRAAILQTLRTINGSPDFTYDLSKTDQVKSGKYDRPPGPISAPFACVWLAQVDENPTGLPAYTQEGIFWARLWVPMSPKFPGSRQDAAEDLLDDARLALRRNPRLRYNDADRVQKFTVSAAPWDDDATAKPGESYATTVLAIAATWRERA